MTIGAVTVRFCNLSQPFTNYDIVSSGNMRLSAFAFSRLIAFSYTLEYMKI